MALQLGADFERSVRQLGNGFTALRNEYKSLAEQHFQLRKNLALTVEKCDALKRLLPEDSSRLDLPNEPLEKGFIRKRNLDEWLTEMSNNSTAVTSDSHALIKDAELAYFKIQDVLKAPVPSDRPRLSNPSSSRSLQPILEQKRAEQAGQMELDFTLPGSQGKLGCPFAANPTPRSSRTHSEVGGIGRRSKRASFHDPLSDATRPRIAGSSVVSIESDTNPACPIRFLGQHTPEDIAKYFEEHKHELPRSHEVCVKRFQSNAESIKQLDAKYGNLVNMIQDLGQKHKPMLPDVPAEDDDMNEEDTKSHRKIENWANTVAESVAGDGEDVDEAEPQTDTPNDEERVQRFDRPMKDIRVGESPSRPWGVPIPARFLDRNISFATSVARAPVETSASLNPEAGASMVHGSTKANDFKQTQTLVERPTGKCPFDHMALRTKPTEDTMKNTPHGVEDKSDPPGANPLVAHPASQQPHDSTPDEDDKEEFVEDDDNDLPFTLVNHGIAVLGNPKTFKGHRLVNHGTLIMGYGQERMKHTLSQILKLDDA